MLFKSGNANLTFNLKETSKSDRNVKRLYFSPKKNMEEQRKMLKSKKLGIMVASYVEINKSRKTFAHFPNLMALAFVDSRETYNDSDKFQLNFAVQ